MGREGGQMGRVDGEGGRVDGEGVAPPARRRYSVETAKHILGKICENFVANDFGSL